MVADWADWAATQVEQWPDDPSRAVADPAMLAGVARRAQWSVPNRAPTRRESAGGGD